MIIVKLGGSLLDQGPVRCEPWVRWLKREAGAQRVLVVVGGGKLVDALRGQSLQWPLAERSYHWRALSLMDFNARLWSEMYGLAEVDRVGEHLATGPDVAVWTGSARLADEPELEASWRTTSDAVAAWLGWRWRAPVMIVKSLAPPGAPVVALYERDGPLWFPHFDEMTRLFVGRGVRVWWSGPTPPALSAMEILSGAPRGREA